MDKIIKYRFNLKSLSPLFFGSSEKGELLRDSNGNPFITGNSIGGAIRGFLKRYKEDVVMENLGGQIIRNKEQNGKNTIEFIESNIIISDGRIDYLEKDINKKQGTKVNRETATADDGSKYEFEYLSKGTKLSFEIECECNNETPEKKFEDFISYIVDGFNSGELTLGGHFNNGFGKFEIVKLEKKEFKLWDKDSLEAYIFNRNNQLGKLVNIKEYINNYFKYDKVTFKLEGYFPYGVYQNFDIKDIKYKKYNVTLSGIQEDNGVYYIPASSIKGLIKSEIEKLYYSLGKRGENICQNLFGGKDSRGKISFNNVSLFEAKEIEPLKKQDNSKNTHPYSTYNKVDRLTGTSYDNALFHQIEVEGKASITFSLNEVRGCEGYIYPILIVLRNIGLGIIPIGGRTSIGLGEFKAEHIKIITQEEEINIKFMGKCSFEIDNKKKLNEFKESFDKALKLGEV